MDGEPDSKKEEKKAEKVVTMADFQPLRKLGEGSYAKVVLGKHKTTGKTFALKIILRSHMQKVEEYNIME